MPDEITSEDLDTIEARANAASKGPWQSFVEGRDHTSGDDFIRTGGIGDDGPDMYVSLCFGADRVPAPAADLDFIAAARQDLLRLVDEIRRLRSTP